MARIKILSGLKIDENRVPQDGRFSAKINNKDIDFRVSTFPTLYGEKVEMRVLDPSTGLRSFEELGLTGRNLEVVKEAIKKPYGMILFTGPTGSGKTTTQYAILRILNQDSVNIVTVEDPIEYSIAGINQSQVKPEIGYTFANGLRQILRQDPNIIMVGEIRDEETASLGYKRCFNRPHCFIYFAHKFFCWSGSKIDRYGSKAIFNSIYFKSCYFSKIDQNFVSAL